MTAAHDADGVPQADGSIALEPTMDVAARRRRRRLHGQPAARRQRPVHDRDGDEDAVRRPRLRRRFRTRAYPLLMESKARSSSLFYRASYRKTASHFSGRTLGSGKRNVRPCSLPADDGAGELKPEIHRSFVLFLSSNRTGSPHRSCHRRRFGRRAERTNASRDIRSGPPRRTRPTAPA